MKDLSTDDPDSLGYIPASKETCIHPNVFDFNGAPTQFCTHCLRDIPRELL